MNSEEYEFYRKKLEEQQRRIRNSYQRIKEKSVWLFCTNSNSAVVSLSAKFNNRNSPRDKTLHVKGGYLLPILEG